MISTGYPLPFRFVYTKGVFSSERGSFLRIRYRDPQAADSLSAAVRAFALLASSGALCGDAIDPGHSMLTLRQEPSASALELRWSIERALLCEEALVVLAHVLHAVREPSDIETVEVLAESGDGQSIALAHDAQLDSTYPARARQPGFALDDDELEADAYALQIELEEPLAPHCEAWLNQMLAAWTRLIELGGFSMAPVGPESSYVEADEAVTTYEQTIEWALFKLRADEACIDTLVNGLAAFHARCQRIRQLAMQ